ncbi:ArsC family reductase [Methylosarcina fibrata]|uniref:ArsC family reductase n=1 Tax=Methylosarcina fibrata TaxID=105972 RepID=UPI00036A30D4|nr:ArsC family reductase [Methylosarcina fibrata]
MITLYGIKNCDTCKKAQKWLEQNGIACRLHDYRSDGLTSELLNRFADRLGWENLLNRSSTSWRQLTEEQRADPDRDKACRLMLATPTLIKRPILDTGTELMIGFKADRYAALFSGPTPATSTLPPKNG